MSQALDAIVTNNAMVAAFAACPPQIAPLLNS